MHFKDKILTTLVQLSSNDFIENEVKYKFTKRFYHHYGLRDYQPKEEEYKNEYVLSINDTNLETGITRQLNYYHTLDGYLPEFIEECFVKFYDDFFRFAVTVDAISGRRIYFNYLNGCLEDIAKEIKNSVNLSSGRRSIIYASFKKGIKTFNKTFGKKKVKVLKGRSNVPHSFVYKKYPRNSDLLEELRNSMIKKGLIDEDTHLSRFKRIFSGEEVYHKVVWRGNKSQLYYFVKYLNSHPSFEDKRDYKWEVAMKCFDFIDKKTQHQFDWRKLKGTHPPILKKREIIENCFIGV